MKRALAAAIRSRRVARNAAIDLKYHGLLSGKSQSAFEHMGSRHVENSDYKAMDHVFTGRLQPADVLVDVGCGKGRVINWWLRNGYTENKIYGLELDPKIAKKTRRRLTRYSNVTILAGDAIEQLPADATVLYLYNPFDASVMTRFIDQAKTTYAGSKLKVLYYNCKHVGLFEADPAWQVEVTTVGTSSVAPFDGLAEIDLVTAG